jgi:hypothetical protein
MRTHRVGAEIHPDVIEPRPVITLDIEEHEIAGIDRIQIGDLRTSILNQDDAGCAGEQLE